MWVILQVGYMGDPTGRLCGGSYRWTCVGDPTGRLCG